MLQNLPQELLSHLMLFVCDTDFLTVSRLSHKLRTTILDTTLHLRLHRLNKQKLNRGLTRRKSRIELVTHGIYCGLGNLQRRIARGVYCMDWEAVEMYWTGKRLEWMWRRSQLESCLEKRIRYVLNSVILESITKSAVT